RDHFLSNHLTHLCNRSPLLNRPQWCRFASCHKHDHIQLARGGSYDFSSALTLLRTLPRHILLRHWSHRCSRCSSCVSRATKTRQDSSKIDGCFYYSLISVQVRPSDK